MRHMCDDYARIQDPALGQPKKYPGVRPIAEDEPVFLLRARDITAGATVRAWADLNERLGGDAEAISLARTQADRMDLWSPRKLADIPLAK